METVSLENLYGNADMNGVSVQQKEKLEECDRFCRTPYPQGCEMYVLIERPKRTPLTRDMYPKGKLAIIIEKPVMDGSNKNGYECRQKAEEPYCQLIILFDSLETIKKMFETRVIGNRKIVANPKSELKETHPSLYHMLNTSKMAYDGDMSPATRYQGQIYLI